MRKAVAFALRDMTDQQAAESARQRREEQQQLTRTALELAAAKQEEQKLKMLEEETKRAMASEEHDQAQKLEQLEKDLACERRRNHELEELSNRLRPPLAVGTSNPCFARSTRFPCRPKVVRAF